MIGVKVKRVNFNNVLKAMKRINDKLDKPGGFIGYAGERGHKEIIKHFRDEKGEEGAWPSLKVRQGRPLQDTGRLRASIIWHKVKEATIEFIALVKYSIYHDKGTKTIPKRKGTKTIPKRKGTKRIPKRQFMWFSKSFMSNVKNNFVRYVLGK